MEYSKVKPIINGLWIIGALILLYFLGLGGDYAYKDKGEDYIDVYPNGNVAVETIEGVETDGKPIRVIIDKTYNGVSLSLYGEREESVGEFSFFHDTGRSYDINYEEYDGNLYLDRTLQYVEGYYTLSIGLILIIIINVIELVTHLLSMGEEKNSSNQSVIQVGLFKHINNAVNTARKALLAVLGVLLMLAYFFDQIVFFLYERSDLELLQGFWWMVFVITAFAFINEFINNSMEFGFRGDRLTVSKRNKVLFEDNIDNIIYEEIIVRSSRTILFKEYQTLQLKLRNNSAQSMGVKLDLMSFGYDKFKAITNILEAHSKQEILQDHEFIDEKETVVMLPARDYSNTTKLFVNRIIVTVIVLIAFILTNLGLKLDFMISVVAFLIALIYLIVSMIVMIAKKGQMLTFTVLDDAIQVGTEVIRSEGIVKIYMSDPSEIGVHRKKLTIQTLSGKRIWHFEPRIRLQNLDKEGQYQLLFNGLKDQYRSVFHVA